MEVEGESGRDSLTLASQAWCLGSALPNESTPIRPFWSDAQGVGCRVCSTESRILKEPHFLDGESGFTTPCPHCDLFRACLLPTLSALHLILSYLYPLLSGPLVFLPLTKPDAPPCPLHTSTHCQSEVCRVSEVDVSLGKSEGRRVMTPLPLQGRKEPTREGQKEEFVRCAFGLD